MVRWILVVITIVGFIVLDIAYTAVVVNYCIQCQLLVYLIRSICERIKAKDWEIDQSIRVCTLEENMPTVIISVTRRERVRERVERKEGRERGTEGEMERERERESEA